MATGFPTQPTDSRWMPKRRTLILVGVGIQAFFLAAGVYLIRANRAQINPPLLVAQVLVPEDMVYSTSDMAVKKGKRLPPVDVKKMSVASADLVSKGQALYAQNCASCHGESGKGDGPSGAGLNPKPRNLTSLNGWKRGTRLSDIFRTTTLGLPGTQMSAYEYLAAEERFAITHYVMSFARGHGGDTPASLDSLDREFSLSAGSGEPNVIPLSMARDKVIGEALQQAAEPDSERVAALMVSNPQGARVFAAATNPARLDRVRAALAADTTWIWSTTRLRSIVTNGVPANGFTARAVELNAEEWLALSRYLANRYRTP